MAKRQIIGRVSVKVTPDTTDFRRQAENQLDRIEKTVRPAVFRARLDFTGMRRDALQQVREFNAENRVMDSRKIRFHTTIARGDMDRVIGEAIRDLNQKAADRRMRIRAGVVAAVTEVELSKESLEKLKRDLERWREDNEPIKIKVEPDLSATNSAYVNRRLQLMARPRAVSFVPTLNQAAAARVATALAALSGARLVNSTIQRLTDLFKNLDKNIPIVGSIALAFAGLAGWIGAASSNLFSLAASLAQIGPIVLPLAGIFAGIAIGLGASYAVLKDFNERLPEVAERFKALQDTMSDTFWDTALQPIQDMIDHLFPQLEAGLTRTSESLGTYFASLATAFRDVFDGALGGMFDDLNESIDIAATGVTDFANIIKVLGETGAGYLPRLAEWFNEINASFSQWLTDAAEDGRLEEWIDRGIRRFQELSTVIKSTGDIIYSIGLIAEEAGGSSLSTLAVTMERIESIVKSPAFQTPLASYFDGAHTMMKNIADISGPSMTAMFERMAQSLNVIMPVAGTAIGLLLNAFADLLGSSGVQQGLFAFFDGLVTGIAGLAPGLTALAPAFAVVGRAIGDIGALAGPLLASVFKALVPVIMGLLPPLLEVAAVLSGVLIEAIKVVTPLLATLAPVIGDLLLTAVRELEPVMGDLVVQFGEFITALIPMIPLWGELAIAFLPLLPAFASLALEILPPLTEAIIALTPVAIAFVQGALAAAPVIIDLVTTAFAFLRLGISQVMEKVTEAADRFATFHAAFDQLVQNMTTIFLSFKTLFEGDWRAMWSLVSTILSGAVGTITGIASGLWQSLTSGFSTMYSSLNTLTNGGLSTLIGTARERLSAMKDTALGILDALVRALPTPLQNLVREFTGAFSDAVEEGKVFLSRLKTALSSPDLLYSAGAAIIRGFINGMKSMFGAVQSSLSGLTKSIPNWKGPVDTDRTLLVDAGRLVMDGFLRGLESRYAVIRSSLRGFTSDIGATTVAGPSISGGSASRGLSGSVGGAIGQGGSSRTFIYNAASGSSLGSEEDLFAALGRGRAFGL